MAWEAQLGCRAWGGGEAVKNLLGRRDMDLDTLLQTVEDSSLHDWHQTSIPTLCRWEMGEPGEVPVRPLVHRALAVYRPDVDISLAHGAETGERLFDFWTKSFPDWTAIERLATLRYR